MRTFALAALGSAVWLFALISAAPDAFAEDPTKPIARHNSATPPGIATASETKVSTPVAPSPTAAAAACKLSVDERRDLARRDPSALARLAIGNYDALIRDYACTFTKQERIDDKLRDAEEIDVLFRVQPHSVYMKWVKNEDQARRVLFVDSPTNVDKKGRKLAKVEPAGALIRLVVSEIDMPINGDRAKAASRRTIDEFGFRSTLDLLEKYNRVAEANGVLDYRYDGDGVIDGRPTFIFIRKLPHVVGKDTYPDARMVLHLDQEWLLPTALYSYADVDGKVLLGSYVFSKVRVNPGLTDADFRF